MEERTIGIRELKNGTSAIVDSVERGESVTITKRGKAVARIVPVGVPAHVAAAIEDGSFRPAAPGPRYLPKPIKLRGEGPLASDYVSEGRR